MAHDGRLLAGVTVLMAVVEAGSLSRAAGALGLTPSGVGRSISQLETRVSDVGIAQVMALGTGHLLAGGQLVDLLPDWPEETFPLSAIYPARQHCAAKVQVFTDFCIRLLGGA